MLQAGPSDGGSLQVGVVELDPLQVRPTEDGPLPGAGNESACRAISERVAGQKTSAPVSFTFLKALKSRARSFWGAEATTHLVALPINV